MPYSPLHTQQDCNQRVTWKLAQAHLSRGQSSIALLVAVENVGQGGGGILYIVPAEGRARLFQEGDGRELAALAQEVAPDGRVQLLPLPALRTQPVSVQGNHGERIIVSH